MSLCVNKLGNGASFFISFLESFYNKLRIKVQNFMALTQQTVILCIMWKFRCWPANLAYFRRYWFSNWESQSSIKTMTSVNFVDCATIANLFGS